MTTEGPIKGSCSYDSFYCLSQETMCEINVIVGHKVVLCITCLTPRSEILLYYEGGSDKQSCQYKPHARDFSYHVLQSGAYPIMKDRRAIMCSFQQNSDSRSECIILPAGNKPMIGQMPTKLLISAQNADTRPSPEASQITAHAWTHYTNLV